MTVDSLLHDVVEAADVVAAAIVIAVAVDVEPFDLVVGVVTATELTFVVAFGFYLCLGVISTLF